MAPKKKAKAAAPAADPAAAASEAATTSTLSERALRSLKRTHEMYLSNYGQRPDVNEASHRLKLQAKLEAEYGLVKDMGAPGAKPGAAAAPAASSSTTTQRLLQDLSAEREKAGEAAPSGSTALALSQPAKHKREAVAGQAAPVVGSAPRGSTYIMPRQNRNSGPDLPAPEWHAPWKLMRVISGHLGWVRCIAVDPTNHWFVTGSADRTIKIWDLASGTLKLTLTGHISTVRGLAVSARSPYLFSAGEDKMVKCWDLEYNKVIRHYHGHLSGVYCLSLHPTLDYLVTGGRDATARVWDVRTKNNVVTLTGHTQTVVSLQTQALEPQVISGSMDSTIRLWDLVAGRASAVLTNHKKAVRSVLVHPREYTFVSGAADNLKKWKCPEGRFLHNLSGPQAHHNAILHGLAVNQDDVLVSGADNGKIHLWDWKSGHNFQTLETVAQPGSLESEKGIYACAFDLSGSRLITGEADKTIKVWKEDPDATPASHPVDWVPPRDRKKY